MSKYGEPWKIAYRKWRGRCGLNIVRTGVRGPPGLPSVSRAIACVNACAGIDHPERLPELIAAAKELLDANEEYDGIVSAVQAPFQDFARCFARIGTAQVRLREAYRAVMGEQP